jgi:rhodanese-related sulfurtransferase
MLHLTGKLLKPGALFFLRKLVVLILLATLTGCELPYTNLDNNELEAMLSKDIPIYDVRRIEEWKQTGIVEGSRLLTFVDASGRPMPDFFERFTATVGKDDPVILICRTGNRTGVLARLLTEELGYTNVYNVRNGITEWIRDKRPVSRL